MENYLTKFFKRFIKCVKEKKLRFFKNSKRFPLNLWFLDHLLFSKKIFYYFILIVPTTNLKYIFQSWIIRSPRRRQTASPEQSRSSIRFRLRAFVQAGPRAGRDPTADLAGKRHAAVGQVRVQLEQHASPWGPRVLARTPRRPGRKDNSDPHCKRPGPASDLPDPAWRGENCHFYVVFN